MKVHYREVIEHDIEIDIEAVIAMWKKIIAGYTVNDDWPNKKETDDILEDVFSDVLYYPPTREANYFLADGDKWDIFGIDGFYGTKVAGFCENMVAEYLRYWGLLP